MIYSFIDSPGGGLTGYLLDDYPNASVGFSFRKLRASYAGSCCRVRRASDNTEQDIGFSGDVVDTAAIATFCSGTTGFIVKMYDQSGNANDSAQTTTGNQYRVYNAGMVTLNAKTAFETNGSTEHLVFTSGVNMSGVNWSSAVVTLRNSAQRSIFMANSGSGGILTPTIWNDGNLYAQKAATYYFAAETSTSQVLLTSSLTAGTPTVRKNGSPYSLSSGGNSGTDTINAIGIYSSTAFVGQGKGQEFVLWPSDQSANMSGIESNINSYYAIF